MPTPYDGKTLLVQVKGQFLARKSLGDVSRFITEQMPNVDGVFLQTSQGVKWQGDFDNDPKEVSGRDAVSQWVSALASRGLDTHVWGIPHGLNVPEEARRFVEAASVTGVKSLALDVEHGNAYYRGNAEGAQHMMQLIRDSLGWDFHIALILDARRNRPFNVYVDPWLPFVNSLHPMIYPKDFGKPVKDAIDAAFSLLAPYGKPIVPMLQSYNATPGADITLQGDYAFQKGAAGISWFCLGDRHLTAAECTAIACVQSPGRQQQKTQAVSEKLPPGTAGVWPDDARGYAENIYEQVASRPWNDFRDTYGHLARWKLTSPSNDVVVTYTPNLPAPGRYSVEIFVPRDNADATRADYHVIYFEGDQERERQVKIDQSARSDEWVALGVFSLDSRRPGDGRVNVTDFSDEQPSLPIAFAGVRWVPVDAAGHAQPAADSQARLLAQQGASGAAKPAAPAAPAAPVGPTNQDVINAFVVTGAHFGERWQDMIANARLNAIYDDRKAAYGGPAIAALPNLADDRKTVLAEALRMPAADLAKAAANAGRRPAAGKSKPDGRAWGVHGAAGSAAPPRHMWDFWINEFRQMGLRWYKQCDSTGPNDTGEGSIFRWALALREAGITPVIRYQVGHQFPNRLDGDRFAKMSLYAREGIPWAEIGNEPNLDIEWSRPEMCSWQNNDCIRALAELWMADSEEALRRGARPAFYAMAPVDVGDGRPHPTFSGAKFHERIWQYLGADAGRRERARNIFRSGGWLAVHVAVYEFALDFDPFPQGRGWDQCLRAYEIPVRFIEQNLGLKGGVDFPIMSTESGVFTPESHSMRGHPTLPNDDAHADLMLKMFDWLEENSPLQAMMPWCVAVAPEIGLDNPDFPGDGWYYNRGGLQARSVVNKMKAARAQRR